MDFLKPLWEHQKDTLELAKDRPHHALFHEMGVGKTATTVNLLRYKCALAKRQLRTLIICPVVVCENWKREIAIHSRMIGATCVLKGSGKARLEIFRDYEKRREGNFIAITNFEAVQMRELYLALMQWKPEVLIIDESQRVKNPKAQRTKFIIALSDLVPYKYLLSGTPILNNPMDIYSQYRILDGGETFGKNYYAFRNQYFYDKNAGMPSQKYFPDWRPRGGTLEVFNQKIYKKANRVLKKDCLDLPPLVKQRVFVELGTEQEKMYESMKKHFIAYLSDKKCVAQIALTKCLRMQQILSGFFVSDEGEVTRFKDNPRIKALIELVEDLVTDHKIIIWATFQENYAQLQEALAHIPFNFAFLTGGLTDRQRQKHIDSFQNDPETRIMIANQGAGGVGVNLTAADYAIYFSRNYSLEQDMQSEARNHRGGSEVHEKITRVDIVAQGTLDELILEALYRKEDMANTILSLKEKI